MLSLASSQVVDMYPAVATRAKRNQVFFRIITGLAAEFFVVNFKMRLGATRLASPAIAAQDLVAELVVQLRIKPQARTL